MVFNLLGPFEAFDDGTNPVALGRRKTRALLARLVLDAGRTVPMQRLIDDLWGETAPQSAAKMVQIHVSQLRKALPGTPLLTKPPGYLVEVDAEAVDVNRFRRLRSEARAALAAGDAAAASGRLREALALWRGPALAEFSEPFAQVEGAHLEELYTACLEERIEADLALGLHADVVAELETLVARHPLREALHGQLMLALYRAGRQADALEAYQRFMRTLDEELGIEPSAPLKELQRRILTQAPELEPAAAPVVSAGAAPVRGRDRFVGRASELARLEAAVDAAAGGHGTAVLVAGHAGIGKTRLAAALADRVRTRTTFLGGRCIPLVGAGLPYLPLVDALRHAWDLDTLEGVAHELHELPRLIPDLGDEPAAPPLQSRDDSRLRLFEEVLAVLDRIASVKPVVLLLEDLHWADTSTLDLVAFLTHAVRERRVVLVATYRSEEVLSGGDLHRLAAELVGSGVAISLQLEPLARDELEALLADARLPADQRAAIAARSEGNPLFARELLAANSAGETALPPALRDLLQTRIGRLDSNARAGLRAAAAVGRDVPYRLLASVLPLGELELAEALREAVEQEVLVADQAAGTFRFRHELFAETVYATLLPGEREALHERLARAISEEPRLAARGVAAAEEAHHWVAAGRPAEALSASLRAAREAEAVSGLAEALHHVQRVLELWDAVPVAEQLTGVALPTVVAWAVELADVPTREHNLDTRRLIGVLGPGQSLDVATIAERVGVTESAAEKALAMLERDGLIERAGDGTFRSASLAIVEARRLYPSVVVLESLAVRQSPPFGPAVLAEMRAANDRLRAAVDDPAAASAADDDFHRALTADCGNEHLLAALRPIRRALLRYEHVYLRDPARINRSVAQHEAIVAALERGDQAEASQLVRANLAGGLRDLTDALEP